MHSLLLGSNDAFPPYWAMLGEQQADAGTNLMSFAVSELRALLSAISELHENGSMLELERKILTLEEAFLELQEENLNLRLELKAVRESLQEKDTMKYETPFYFLFDGERKIGPFCQRCYDVDGKKVRLIEHSYMMGSHRCNACDSYYGPPRDVAVESPLDASRVCSK